IFPGPILHLRHKSLTEKPTWPTSGRSRTRFGRLAELGDERSSVVNAISFLWKHTARCGVTTLCLAVKSGPCVLYLVPGCNCSVDGVEEALNGWTSTVGSLGLYDHATDAKRPACLVCGWRVRKCGTALI